MSRFEVVDLPGTYSLDVVDREVSLDEKVARDYVHANEADLIINIVDASNLERNLYLTSQLAEMRVPLLVVLNMVDVAEGKGMQVDAEALSRQLGCPVLPVVASEGIGIDALKAAIKSAVAEQPRATALVEYQAPWTTPSPAWRRAWKKPPKPVVPPPAGWRCACWKATTWPGRWRARTWPTTPGSAPSPWATTSTSWWPTPVTAWPTTSPSRR
jgi:hypothetical protein